uniref:dCTP pyrophosphatase 1 n=1 Tax=Strigamia maritima TaxID=126957 RepID=T1IXX7_STRMM
MGTNPQLNVASNNLSDRDEKFQFSNETSFESLRQKLEQFSEERNWNSYHTPRNLLLALVGEVGELSEIFQWKGEVQVGLPDWSEKDRKHVAEELSDVLLYLLRLADKCKIDLPSAALEKIELNAIKYPAELVKGSSEKYTKYNRSM